jgi:adenylate cyclase
MTCSSAAGNLSEKMADVFISYARSDEPHAIRVADSLRTQGYTVWRDDELPAHRDYAEVIEERLKSAGAVIVLWSAAATKSQWVRAEADVGRSAQTLVQATLDGTIPPLPFNQIQCADLSNWTGEIETHGWSKLLGSVRELISKDELSPPTVISRRRGVSICVLPFANMSGDAEQEYFSDGISEDITTDLSKVSALEVIARNTAFSFKGKSVDVGEIARNLGVSHILEGSVRKAGSRVRISAQLIDGSSGGHLWAERYDRDLTDIFAIQDEISHAIVAALKLKLLPEERRAIENRGTASADAYNLYLKARQHWIGGVYGDVGKDQAIVRLCKQAVALDPNYAQAWALMALAQAELRFWHGIASEDALPAAERALSLNPDLPEARCVKARYLEQEGHEIEANEEVEAALRFDPESWEVNREAARLLFRDGRFREAIPFFEKASDLMSTDFHSPGMLLSCYRGIGNEAGLRSSAERVVKRAEETIAKDPANVAALAHAASGLSILGQEVQAREWINRASLLDPDNVSTLYNLACALNCELADQDAALDMLERFFERLTSTTILKHIQVDPDMLSLRDHPRFNSMLTAAKKRMEVTA